MSIAQSVKVQELEARVSQLEALLKSNAMQSEIEALKSRLDAIEARPKPGRPPKEANGRQSAT